MSGAAVALSTGKPALSASVSPTELTGTRFGVGTAVTLSPAIVTVIGGAPPYTYAWTYVSGSIEIDPLNINSSSTKFAAYFNSAGTYDSVYKCVVTDSLSVSVNSNNVNISMEAF
jgi:hypothetical protein